MKHKLTTTKIKSLFTYNSNKKFTAGMETDPTTSMTNMTVTGVLLTQVKS